MAIISRIKTWGAEILQYTDLNTEFNNLVNFVNNVDAATTIWDNVKTAILTMTGNIVMQSNKITGLANGTVASDAMAFGQNKYFQTIQGTNAVGIITSSATFVATNLTATITPTSASNRIKITVSSEVLITISGDGAYTSVKRGSIELGTGGASGPGFSAMFAVAANQRGPVAFVYIDSPATTSATIYTVETRSNGGTSIQWNDLSVTSVIVLEEIV